MAASLNIQRFSDCTALALPFFKLNTGRKVPAVTKLRNKIHKIEEGHIPQRMKPNAADDPAKP